MISAIRGGKFEFRTLATLLLVVALMLTFGLVANEMSAGDTRAFDNAILMAMRNDANPRDPIGPGWFEEGVRDVTSLGSNAVLIIIVLGTCGFLWLSRAHGASVLVLVLGGWGGRTHTGAQRYVRPGPARCRVALSARADTQLPERSLRARGGHLPDARCARSRACSQRARTRTYVLSVAILLTLLVGVSRVYLGRHWPTDVLAGWCLGADVGDRVLGPWRHGSSAPVALKKP
jgi:undecaprenyl-diphosphatase